MNRTILVCGESVPQPSRDTASLRLWRILQILHLEGWRVTFSPFQGPTPPASGERLRAEGIELLEPGIDALAGHLAAGAPEVALVSRPHVADHILPVVREVAPSAALVYDTLDLAHLRVFRQAKEAGNLGAIQAALRFKALELELTRAADVTLVVSEVERDILAEEIPDAELVVVPSIHTGGEGPPPPRSTRRPEVVFVAYWPNHANHPAARLLLQEIWPALAERDRELRLLLVGIRPPGWLADAAEADDRITVTGHVPDIGALLDSAWCTIVPLTFGAGVKGKVLSSLAHGLPTVGTTIAWEGVPVVDGVHGLIADDPAAMVEAALRLRTDPALWDRLHAAGPKLIEERFSFAAARSALLDALDRARDRAEARA
jgi:glycosyltransferase involved in cell wall biosynthesis